MPRRIGALSRDQLVEVDAQRVSLPVPINRQRTASTRRLKLFCPSDQANSALARSRAASARFARRAGSSHSALMAFANASAKLSLAKTPQRPSSSISELALRITLPSALSATHASPVAIASINAKPTTRKQMETQTRRRPKARGAHLADCPEGLRVLPDVYWLSAAEGDAPVGRYRPEAT